MSKLVNLDIQPDQLDLANWLIDNVSEFRQTSHNELLAFITPYDFGDFAKKLEACDPDYFTDGVLEVSYNGSDFVIDIAYILRYTCGIKDFSIIDPEWRHYE